jgi:hypothetical protein
VIKRLQKWWNIRQWERIVARLTPEERKRLNTRLGRLVEISTLSSLSANEASTNLGNVCRLLDGYQRPIEDAWLGSGAMSWNAYADSRRQSSSLYPLDPDNILDRNLVE